MAVKVQYNPSTGKASYNPATGKVQVVVEPENPCPLCSTNSPDQIRITPSGFSVSCCAGTGSSTGKSRKWDTPIESIVNDTHVLDALSPCVWRKFISMDVDLLTYESSATCTGTPTTDAYRSLVLQYAVSDDADCRAVLTVFALGGSPGLMTLITAINAEFNCFDVIDDECIVIDPMTPSAFCTYASRVLVTGGTISVEAV